MSGRPTMEKTVTERPCQKVLQWRVSQGRTPCRTDHCGQSHNGDRHAGESHEGGYHPGEIFLESAMVQKPLPEIPAMEKTSLESCTLHESLSGKPTMDKTMPKLPTMDKAVTESPCRKVSRSWRQPDQRAPRGRTPCRRDYSRECHDSENPAGEFRDGEDHFWRVARCMRSSQRVPRWSRQLPERPWA